MTAATLLLVMRAGFAREAAAAELAATGAATSATASLHEATFRVARAAPDLVVLDLDGLRARDAAFVRTARRASPTTRILLLTTDRRRRLAVRCLERGADAYVLAPWHPGELATLARRLLPAPAATDAPAPGPSVARLADELAHALNNPLQALSLLAEEGRAAGAAATAIREAVGRLGDVAAILDRYARVGPPSHRVVDLGGLLREAVEEAVAEGRVRLVGEPPADGARVQADPGMVRGALADLVAYGASHGEGPPVPLRARVRRVRADGGAFVEAAVRARGLRLPAPEFERARESLLVSHGGTRRPLPGLARAAAVAHLHGGRLTARETARGTVLALALPRTAVRADSAP